MNSTDIASELRRISGGGLISVKEVGQFVRMKNATRIKEQYLAGLESCNGRYLVTDVARAIKSKCK